MCCHVSDQGVSRLMSLMLTTMCPKEQVDKGYICISKAEMRRSIEKSKSNALIFHVVCYLCFMELQSSIQKLSIFILLKHISRLGSCFLSGRKWGSICRYWFIRSVLKSRSR